MAAGGMSYAEVCSRGKHRFDMLLCSEGALSFAVGGFEVVAEAVEAVVDAAAGAAEAAEAVAEVAEAAVGEAAAVALLTRVAMESPWCELVEAALLTTHYLLLTTCYLLLATCYLLLATDSTRCELVEAALGLDYTWQARTTHYAPLTTHHAPLTTHHAPRTTHHAPRTTHHSAQASLVCSRPGAPAGGWHADGSHSRSSSGASTRTLALALALAPAPALALALAPAPALTSALAPAPALTSALAVTPALALTSALTPTLTLTTPGSPLATAARHRRRTPFAHSCRWSRWRRRAMLPTAVRGTASVAPPSGQVLLLYLLTSE